MCIVVVPSYLLCFLPPSRSFTEALPPFDARLQALLSDIIGPGVFDTPVGACARYLALFTRGPRPVCGSDCPRGVPRQLVLLALLPAPARAAMTAFAILIPPHPRCVQERVSSAVAFTFLPFLLEDVSFDADRAHLRFVG